MLKKDGRKNLLKLLVPITVVVSLGACSATDKSPEVYTYSKNPNMNFGNFERDKAECTQLARSQYAGRVAGWGILEGVASCMQSKGYNVK